MSRGAALIVLIVAMVAIVGAVVLFAPGEKSDDDNNIVKGEVYSISYVLNGGTLSSDAPAKYTTGEYMDLPVPENGDKFFEGWYTDEGCTIPIGAIRKSTTGDQVLYASWADNLVGTGFVMDIEGKADSFLFKKNYSGTMSWQYEAYADGAYYVQHDTNLRIGGFGPFGGNYINETDYYWTDEEDDDVAYVYTGNKTISGNFFGEKGSYLCEVWESEEDTQYVYRSNYALKIESSSNGIDLTYTFKEPLTFEPVTEFEPTVYAYVGLSVDAPKTAKIGQSYTVTASGSDFYGWYVDGQLATTSKTFTDTRASPDKVYVARTSEEYLVYEDRTLLFSDYGLVSPVTIVYDDGTTDEFKTGIEFKNNANGYFTLIDSSEPVQHILRLYKEKTTIFSVTWQYGTSLWSIFGKSYTISFDMKYSDVYDYTSNGKDRDEFRSYSDVSPYFTVDDKYVQLMCSELLKYKAQESMTDREFAEFVMICVQTIPYQYDEVSRHAEEYWKYPAETFWDGGGDCEDSSILYCTLMKAMGYETALIVFYDHAMASIHFANDSDNYGDEVVTISGKKYVLVETTSTGYELGEVFDYNYGVNKIRKTFVVGAEPTWDWRTLFS